jgi:lysyl-tRNA synthetase class 2
LIRKQLEARAAVIRAVRSYFEHEGLLEVETPARVSNPGQELHLDAFAAGLDGRGRARYLITSPEHHMKRLVAAGYGQIFQICRSFRQDESGPHHQPEFTMLEWYRAGAPLEMLADDCEAIMVAASEAVGRPKPGPARRTTVSALFETHAGIRLCGDESVEELAEKARAAGIDPRGAQRFEELFFQIYLDYIEPSLAAQGPTFVFDWPRDLAALARLHPTRPTYAERFELYAEGLELVNAFGELTDPSEQRRRFEAERAERDTLGKTVYPIDEALIEALGRMPPTSGAAMGVDRLVMWAVGAGEISQVVAFSDEEV